MNLIHIDNKAGKVKLTEVVTPASISKLIEEMDLIFGAKAASDGLVTGEITNYINNAADTIDIEIHSPGGSVFDGYRAYHAILAMRQRGVHVTATINSLAASMGSVIAMAADKIRMVEGGRMMIHEASQNIGSSDAEAHARAALMLEGISSEIAAIYSKRTGSKQEEMRALMKKETWMGTADALALGFIDEAIQNCLPKNSLAIGGGEPITETSMSLLTKLLGPSNEEIVSQLEAVKADLATVENDLKAEIDKNSVAEAALQEAATEIQSLREKNQELEAKASKVESLEAKVEESEAKIAEAENSAAQKAVEIIAEAGHEEAIPVVDSEAVNHLAVFNSLKGSERTAYFKKHISAIRKGL